MARLKDIAGMRVTMTFVVFPEYGMEELKHEIESIISAADQEYCLEDFNIEPVYEDEVDFDD